MPSPVDVPSPQPSDVPPPPEPYRYAAESAPADPTRPRWSAGRTAVVAGVTVVLVSAGAVGAAAAVPLGGSGQGGGPSQGFPGGGNHRLRGGFPPGVPGPQTGPSGPQQNGSNGFGQQQDAPNGPSRNGAGRQDGARLPVLPVVGPGSDGADTAT